MNYFWHNNSTPVKIFATLTMGATGYLFFVDGESTIGWTVFFISLILALLFTTIQEQDKEIEKLHSQVKSGKQYETKKSSRSYDPFYGSSAVLSQEEKEKILNKFKKEEETQVIFFRKNPIKPPKDNEQPKL